MKVIQISKLDNVAVALHPIKKGEEVTAGGITVTALEDIPQGHKIALKPIKNGENIVKYGFAIGHATADAEAGAWMHTHNVKTNLEGEMEYTYTPSLNFPEKVEPETFMGFRRKDGRAAIRNEIWIIPTVGCVNDIAKKMVHDNQDLEGYHRRTLYISASVRLQPDRRRSCTDKKAFGSPCPSSECGRGPRIRTWL